MAEISTKKLANLCQRLGTSLEAGVDVVRAIQHETEIGDTKYRHNMSEIGRRVGKGATLADSMRACGGYYPKLTCDLIDVGEQTGRVESVLLRLSDHYRHTLKLRRTFLWMLLWPTLQLLAAILIIGLLILLLGLIDSSSKGIFGLVGPKGLMTYSIMVVTFFGILAIVLRGLARGWFGDAPVNLLLRVPVIGNSIKTMALSRLAWTLSLALNAGIDAQRAIRMALESTQLRFYARHQDIVEGVVSRGGQFFEALKKPGVFSDDFLNALRNSEETGTEAESLANLSRDYQERAEVSSKAVAVAVSFVIWGLIIALIGFVVIYMVMTLYIGPTMDLLNDIQ